MYFPYSESSGAPKPDPESSLDPSQPSPDSDTEASARLIGGLPEAESPAILIPVSLPSTP
jgi:hypothetical protein